MITDKYNFQMLYYIRQYSNTNIDSGDIYRQNPVPTYQPSRCNPGGVREVSQSLTIRSLPVSHLFQHLSRFLEEKYKNKFFISPTFLISGHAKTFTISCTFIRHKIKYSSGEDKNNVIITSMFHSCLI